MAEFYFATSHVPLEAKLIDPHHGTRQPTGRLTGIPGFHFATSQQMSKKSGLCDWLIEVLTNG